MHDYEAEQADRDEGLLRHMCYGQEILADYIARWMQEELRELIWRMQLLEVMTTTNATKGSLAEYKTSIARVSDSDMPDTIRRLKERREEIEGGLYDEPLESQQHLNDSLGSLLDLMRSLLGFRFQVDERWKQCQPD